MQCLPFYIYTFYKQNLQLQRHFTYLHVDTIRKLLTAEAGVVTNSTSSKILSKRTR